MHDEKVLRHQLQGVASLSKLSWHKGRIFWGQNPNPEERKYFKPYFLNFGISIEFETFWNLHISLRSVLNISEKQEILRSCEIYAIWTVLCIASDGDVLHNFGINPQKATLLIRTSKATWGQMWPHHENGYN